MMKLWVSQEQDETGNENKPTNSSTFKISRIQKSTSGFDIFFVGDTSEKISHNRKKIVQTEKYFRCEIF